MKKSGGKAVRYNKWGYIFLIPFIVVYIVFQLIPLVTTIYYSFFENYMSGLTQIGPNFVGFENYRKLFTGGDVWVYFKNTMVLWIMCFIPQIFLSLLLGAWFSDTRLKIKGSRFFKTVIYLPNLIMASAFSMLFFTLFADGGPINSLLMQIGFISEPYKFLSHTGSARGLIALMNCLMWFGNTTIMLMSGIMGINPSLFEAANIDGASASQQFFLITIPLLKPIMLYTMVTSMIGGLQMFDMPYLYNMGTSQNPYTETIAVFIYNHFHSLKPNYGYSAAASVLLFIVTALLGSICFAVNRDKDNKVKERKGSKALKSKLGGL